MSNRVVRVEIECAFILSFSFCCTPFEVVEDAERRMRFGELGVQLRRFQSIRSRQREILLPTSSCVRCKDRITVGESGVSQGESRILLHSGSERSIPFSTLSAVRLFQ